MSGRDAALRRGDADARRLAQTEFTRPVVLEAGAGTGKTTALVARVVAWALGSGWERAEAANPSRPDLVARRVLSGIVAITFTEAAAAEMASRVGQALRVLEAGALPQGLLTDALPEEGTLPARARALHGALDHLVVSTIHAWCRRLLAAHPLDAGLHARLEIDADGRLRQEVAREVLDARLRAGYAAGDRHLLELARWGVGPREIEREILELLDAGLAASVFVEDPFAPDRLDALLARLRAALSDAQRAAEPLSGVGRTAQETFEALARAGGRAARPVGARAALGALLEELKGELPPAARRRIVAWSKGTLNKGESGALSDGGEALAEACRSLRPLLDHVDRIDVERLDLARGVFGALLGEVEEALRARGIATFHQLIEGAGRLLEERPAVAERVRARIDQLLVDEFQDTDVRQCALLRALALRGEPPRAGLFVVGDPKQSIYGWRSADLTAYGRFVEEMRAAGGVQALLSVNHRSVPAVLDHVERVVAPVMQEQAGVQPRFQPLVPSPGNAQRQGFAAAGRAPVEHWVPADWDPEARAPRERTPARQASRLEARTLARELRALHDEHAVAWGDVAVLFRTRGDWDLYLAALREHGVPFAVEGDRSYYRRREIVDAAGLVRCVLDPNDALALLTLLRSSAVGVPDAALIPLWERDLPRRMAALHAPDADAQAEIEILAREVAASLPEDVPGLARVAGWERNLTAWAQALGTLRLSARRDAADVFVEKLRTQVLLEAVEAARFQGPWRAANLDRFFRDLSDDLEAGASFHAVLRRLRGAVAEERDAEEARPQEIREDAVQILTIHGAKGLDFEQVFVMQLHKAPAPPIQRSVELRPVDGRIEYRLLGAPTAGWDRALQTRTATEQAERVRALYVAATRARSRLVLSGLASRLAHAQGRRGRMVELVEEALGVDAAALMDSCAAKDCHAAEAAAARWVFPALAPERPSPHPGGAPGADPLPDLNEIAAVSARLARARSQMRAHMARPLGAAASDDLHQGPEDREERSAPPEGRGGSASGGVAAAVGTAIHRALEEMDLSAPPDAALARARDLVADVLGAELPAKHAEAARERALSLMDRFAAGPLWPRLRELAPHVLARELPVLVAPGEHDAALGYVSGALDLVYRDPASGRIVVADYKTGARGDFAGQGAVYTRALRRALDLEEEPRFELWYLAEGAIVPA